MLHRANSISSRLWQARSANSQRFESGQIESINGLRILNRFNNGRRNGGAQPTLGIGDCLGRPVAYSAAGPAS